MDCAKGHGASARSGERERSDQVQLPSTWWQPRIGFRPVSVEQMVSGPDPGTGPAPDAGRFRTAGSGRDAGIPGEDRKGPSSSSGFDPPGFLDLATSAEVIGSRLFWAAGFNVPDVAIAALSRGRPRHRLRAPRTPTPVGRKHPMTQAYRADSLARRASKRRPLPL